MKESGCEERAEVRTRHRSVDVAASHCGRLSAPPRKTLYLLLIPYQSRDAVCIRTAGERYYCRFERRLPGGDGEADKVDAPFKSGVLTVTLPQSAKAQDKVKRIA